MGGEAPYLRCMHSVDRCGNGMRVRRAHLPVYSHLTLSGFFFAAALAAGCRQTGRPEGKVRREATKETIGTNSIVQECRLGHGHGFCCHQSNISYDVKATSCPM